MADGADRSHRVAVAASDRDPSRAHWMELFFDLIFVALAAIALCGGIAIFYVSNALVTLRFGRPPREVLRWALPAVVLMVPLGVVAVVADAAVGIGAAVAVLIVVVVVAEMGSRRRAAVGG